MTTNNINKFVQSNINLKPWVLSKNTSEIVNTYIQKIYKQMPNNFRKERTPKVATPRAENKGPLRTFKSQEGHIPLTIAPTTVSVKKPSKLKQRQDNNLMNSLKLSNNNKQIASKFAGPDLTYTRRPLKTPNYKIYKSRRFGSSASSSRSSLFRRYDERRSQRQNYPAQINYLIRSFHTSQFDPTYARYLMPLRNQQVEARLSSIPDAIKFSNDIQNDLMTVDSTNRNRFSTMTPKKIKLRTSEHKNLVESLPTSVLEKYRKQESKDSPVKSVKDAHERDLRKAKILPKQQPAIYVNHMAQLKHPKPPNELFIAQHDRNNTELHEKHRRNRMKKLGLIKSPTPSEFEVENIKGSTKTTNKHTMEQQTSPKDNSESILNTANQIKSTLNRNSFRIKDLTNNTPISMKENDLMDINNAPKFQGTRNSYKNPSIKKKPENLKKLTNLRSSPFVSLKTNLSSSNINSASSVPIGIPIAHSINSPIAIVRAQMPNKNNYRNYRYNRADFFSTKKY